MAGTSKTKKSPAKKVAKKTKTTSRAAKATKKTASKATKKTTGAKKAKAEKSVEEPGAEEPQAQVVETPIEAAEAPEASPETEEAPKKVKSKAAPKVKAEKPEKIIEELAKKGESPSRIGIILRDQFGIGSVRKETGKKMGKLLEESGSAGDIPEDLSNLVRRRAQLIKHNEANRQDMSSKRGQQMVEARIIRLSNYYKRRGKIPKDWSYKKAEAVR